MKDDKSPQSETRQNYYDFPERLKTPALWIVVLMYVLVIIFYLLDINAKYDSTNLNIILNTIFVVIPSLFIAFIAARSFLRTGNWPVLWMGVGTLSFGLAVLLSFLVRFWWPVIVGLTNFPIIVLFAGLFYFLAALFLFSRTPPYESGRGRIAILLSVNIIAIVMAIIATIISILNILPPFFIQGEGSTALRQIIIIIASLLFLISGVTIYQQYRKSKFLMLYWLALGLLLIFLAISTNLLVISIGTPVTWLLRITQLLGGVYLFMAALVILKEAKIQHISAGEALASFFQERKQNLNLLFDNITDAIIVNDSNFIITGWNKGAEKIYGWKAEEAIGNTTEFLKIQYNGTSKEDVINQVVEKGNWSGEVESITKDGRILSLWSSFSIVKDEFDNSIGFMSVVHDFTERKKLDEELKKSHDELELKVQERTAELDVLIDELKRSNQELQHFAHVASHDLQEPLRTIASFTQLLEHRYKGQLDSDADEFMDYIVEAAKRMQTLINDLLQYSRVTTQAKEFQSVNVNEVLYTVLHNLKTSIDENNAEIRVDNLPTLMADGSQLVQLFQNLIGNAIKFKKADEPPKIHISAEKDDDKNEYVFSVSDNGIGMEPQYKDRIFVIFQRLHTMDVYKGTGIGLSVAKKIVERHGGHIWVESKLGEGTTFYFTIPIEPVKTGGGAIPKTE